MNNDSPRLRLGILGLVMLSLFATLFARLWYLQILAHDEFSLQATANRERVILEQAPRGRILDRNMNVLVDNRVSIVVTVDRNKLPKAGKPERDTLLDRLALEISTFTGKALTREEIERRLNDVRYSPYTPVPVTEDVPKELQLYIDDDPQLPARPHRVPRARLRRVHHAGGARYPHERPEVVLP
jgi:penicillin-binding protein 2